MKRISLLPMHYGASIKLFDFAEEMRENPTETERLMWEVLDNGQFKQHNFRRQHPMALYIADFYSHSLRLVIEIDGGYHLGIEQKEYDVLRDDDMKEFGITVLRFGNNDVLQNVNHITDKIQTAIQTQTALSAGRSSL